MSYALSSLPVELEYWRDRIRRIALEMGLDFFETIFEMVDFQQMNEIAAYMGFPTRYPHWRWGMEYERMRRSYTYGLHKIYEMVINNDPSYAYLLDSNELIDQKLVMAHVYGHCLAPETKIETENGIKAITDVQLGEGVLTHTGHYRPVRVRSQRRFTGDIYRITVSGNNTPIRITGEHPILVMRPATCVLQGRQQVYCRPNCQTKHKCSAPRPYENYQLEWVPAAQVDIGDVVAFPRRQRKGYEAPASLTIPVNKIHWRRHIVGEREISLDVGLAKLIGYFVAEGYALERGLVGFGFHSEEESYHQEVTQLAQSLFNVHVGMDRVPKIHSTTVRFNSMEIAEWLRHHAGVHANNKKIPDFIIDHPDDAVRMACLQGIFNGDGYFISHKERNSGSLSLTTVSETLAYQLRHLCLQWGIQTSIYVQTPKNRQVRYDAVWTGSSAHQLSQLLYGEDVIKGNRSFERSWTDENYLYQHVRSVETESYDGLVYNFSVEKDESYTLAGGCIVHNCDFFKNNMWFAPTNKKMMDEMANHATKVRRIVDRIGMEEVETFIDVCLSLENLIDRHAMYRPAPVRMELRGSEQNDYEEDVRRPPQSKLKVDRSYMDAFINPPEALRGEAEKMQEQLRAQTSRFPAEPQRDVLGFLLLNAPLERWQQDILEIIRAEAYYFAPQGMTKIMNEGWASFNHSLMMTQTGIINDAEIVDYADHHSGTMAMSPRNINPYKIGIELLRDIEERWDKGQFGVEWDSCDDSAEKLRWDTHAGLGRQKIFEVRRVYNDVGFIDTFFTEDFCNKHQLFTYQWNERTGRYEIASRDFEKIKLQLLFSLTNFGQPVMEVVDANHENRGSLLLAHRFEGVELKLDEARDTMENLYKVWKRPVFLQTIIDDDPHTLVFNGSDHRMRKGHG